MRIKHWLTSQTTRKESPWNSENVGPIKERRDSRIEFMFGVMGKISRTEIIRRN